MATLNRHPLVQRTHEGAPSRRISPEMMLRRSVLSCLLWESEAYEDGESIAKRISDYSQKVSKEFLMQLAVEARKIHGLRHVPLLLLTELVKIGGEGVKGTIAQVISRPDEMSELLAIYWKDGKKPLDKQLQRGLALAFVKFSEYQLAKYNRDNQVKLRDVMFMCHPKPKNDQQVQLFKRLADQELQTPDTWEVELSAGKNKKEVFERLIKENKLGYLALLRNLRNMSDAECDPDIIRNAILARKGADLVFPFRYVAAARHAPRFEKQLDEALQATIKELPALDGRTGVLVDVSGSMDWRMSNKSDMNRIDAASALASIVNAEDLRVFSFSEKVVEVPARRGMAGVDAIHKSQSHLGTRLGEAIKVMNKEKFDRLIVITDEQSSGPVPNPVAPKSYMINVASNRNGVGYGDWIHLDGFSEGILKFIHEIEKADFK